MKSVRLSSIILLLLAVVGCISESKTPEISLADAWVRAMPPGANMTAAYGRFTNNSDAVIKIVSLSSDSFAEVSLHATVTKDAISRMQHIKDWQLEAGTSFLLQPGGAHLMLMKPLGEFAEGDEVTISLTTTSGQVSDFLIPVRAK
jgi:copper(I)-binding protein